MAYDAITRVGGKSAETAQAAILGAYSAEVTDEFILPTIINGDNPAPPMRDGDILLFFNFRLTRAQLAADLRALDHQFFARFRQGPGFGLVFGQKPR